MLITIVDVIQGIGTLENFVKFLIGMFKRLTNIFCFCGEQKVSTYLN